MFLPTKKLINKLSLVTSSILTWKWNHWDDLSWFRLKLTANSWNMLKSNQGCFRCDHCAQVIFANNLDIEMFSIFPKRPLRFISDGARLEAIIFHFRKTITNYLWQRNLDASFFATIRRGLRMSFLETTPKNLSLKSQFVWFGRIASWIILCCCIKLKILMAIFIIVFKVFKLIVSPKLILSKTYTFPNWTFKSRIRNVLSYNCAKFFMIICSGVR